MQVTESLSKMDISPIYTSDKTGSDDKGEGTQDNPFKTPLQAMRHWGKVRTSLLSQTYLHLRTLIFALITYCASTFCDLLLVFVHSLGRTHRVFSIYREILGRNFCAASNQHVTNSLFSLTTLQLVYTFYKFHFRNLSPRYMSTAKKKERNSALYHKLR